MKRRQFIKAAGLGVAASAVAAPAIAQSMPEIKWRMTTQLAEVARHAVRRGRNDGQGRCRGDRQQIPDPGICRWRNRAGPCRSSTRCRTAPSRCGHTASYYYFGKDPTFAFGTSVAFGPNAAPEPGLVHARRRQGSAQRVLQEVQLHRVARRQHRLSDGRLVPQGDQYRRRSQGHQDAYRRISRAGPAEARRRAAADRRLATFIRRWKRARSTPPNGSVPMTTKSSASTRSRRTTTIPAGGKAAR